MIYSSRLNQINNEQTNIDTKESNEKIKAEFNKGLKTIELLDDNINRK